MSFLGILDVCLSSKNLLLHPCRSFLPRDLCFLLAEGEGRGFSLGLAEGLALLSELDI